MEILIPNRAALKQTVKTLLKVANGRKKIMLYGEMGAGKTTFVRAFCAHFETLQPAQSPTFSLINEYYYTQNGVNQCIAHLDLYRLKTLEEALNIGIEDYLYEDGYCLIEWPDLIEPIFPADALIVKLEIASDNQRKLLVVG
jgi:tRNA threonylcarbamoyladenosine biosynthesis protein TsaE